jgi:LPS sulfotransferase NodH
MYNYLLHLQTYLVIKQKQLANFFSFRKKENYVPFVILSEPRTGSTLLHTYLNFHSNVISYGEVLREKVKEDISIARKPLRKFVFKPHASQIKAVGLKLFYSYHLKPPFQVAFQEVIDRADVRIIHLIRKDVLQQYVSLQIARETKKWSTSDTPSGKRRNKKMLLDIDNLRHYVRDHYQKQKLLNTLFQEHRMLIIYYEDLKDDAENTLLEVQQFLGVKHQKLKSLLQKQNRRLLETMLENYDEARSVIEEVKAEMKK